jgi:multimeric flavodoxin WrbA
MKYLIVSGNPKKDGLCHSICEEVKRGAEEGGADTEILAPEKLDRCHVCGGGWGTCRDQHLCAFGKDGFDEAQKSVRGADALCFITPVYWEEMAESLKCFFDRLRRCEADFWAAPGRSAALKGKQVLLIASPGGSGNGAPACISQMDRFCRHTGAVIFDYISVNRWNNDYKKAAAFAAAKAMAGGRKAGTTICACL